MGIRTLIKEKMNKLEVQIEKSDTNKVFFGISRNDPKTNESYTFDMGKEPGRLLELFRESLIRLTDGREVYNQIEINANNDKNLIIYSSLSRAGEDQVLLEIHRAYTLVKMYRNKLQSDKDKMKLYPEVLEYVCKIVAFSDEVFRTKYSIVKR